MLHSNADQLPLCSLSLSRISIKFVQSQVFTSLIIFGKMVLIEFFFKIKITIYIE